MIRPTIVTYPTTLAVSVADLKKEVRIESDVTTFDSQLEDYLRTAYEYVELGSNRSLLNTTYSQPLDCWSSKIRLLYPPLVSVQSVQYLDSNGQLQTWSASNYQVFTNAEFGFIYSESSPSYRSQPHAIRINYTAGYGSSPTTLPHKAKLAIKQLAAHWFLHPESVSDVATYVVPQSAADLIKAIRVEEIY